MKKKKTFVLDTNVARIIDGLREKGNLNKGVKLENGGKLRIEMNFHEVKLPES